jgi:hypothetical protein
VALADELRDNDKDLRQEKAGLAAVQAELRRVQKELDRADNVQALMSRFDPKNLSVPTWLAAPSRNSKGKHRGTLTLQLSDTHFDEDVRPDQVYGYNAYNRNIALLRLRGLASKTIIMGREYFAGVDYDGVTVLATGDIFSGDIHEELARTNVTSLYASCVFWVGHMVAFLASLADEFGKVHLAAAVGNHGRNSHKPIYKNRAFNNIEWLFWHWVADHLATQGDKRITFDIADSLQTLVTVYDTRYSIEHGDEFKGGDGQVGALGPLKRGQLRAATQRIRMNKPLDWMVVGHFHQYMPPSQGLIMGGSLKGYDEYAAGKHLPPEPPQQGLWVTTPERGPTVFAPVQPQDRKGEGW